MRFGDPECQGLMALCASDLTDAMLAATRGRLGDVRLDLRPEAALTVVLAARGYPGEYPKGSVIRGLEGVTGAKVFHAGTARNAAGEVVSAGGRVLNVTALGADVAEAQAKAYAVSRRGRRGAGASRRGGGAGGGGGEGGRSGWEGSRTCGSEGQKGGERGGGPKGRRANAGKRGRDDGLRLSQAMHTPSPGLPGS